VVNEAMNFGLPIIVSSRVGSAVDLVEPGGNGFTFPAGDVDALAAAMNALARDASLRARLGARSLEIIETQTIPMLAAAIEDACYDVAARKKA
jgi:glycosyltransferase involved in cell wall biosynthesis